MMIKIKIYVLVFLTTLGLSCSSQKKNDQKLNGRFLISYVQDPSTDKVSAVDFEKSLWYVEENQNGDLNLSGNEYKMYYTHFFTSGDNIYSCCLDEGYDNAANKKKFESVMQDYQFITENESLKKGYSIKEGNDEIVIYKISDLSSCKCGKEKVFPNDKIKDFMVPFALETIPLIKQEKSFFKNRSKRIIQEIQNRL